MISRRDFIAAVAVAVTQMPLRAAQQKPQERDLKTVTLIIDGMT